MAKSETSKARYWTGVLYPENMRKDWETEIGDLLQQPYAYCKHDADKDGADDERKAHVHLIIAFPNTTTYKHVLSIMNKLSAEGKTAINTVQTVSNIRHMYEYLIHNTDSCRKKGKCLYEKSKRISGNNFDIGSYEQISLADKNRMAKELCDVILSQGIVNFADFYGYVVNNYDLEYFEIIKSYSGFFERLIKGNFHREKL